MLYIGCIVLTGPSDFSFCIVTPIRATSMTFLSVSVALTTKVDFRKGHLRVNECVHLLSNPSFFFSPVYKICQKPYIFKMGAFLSFTFVSFLSVLSVFVVFALMMPYSPDPHIDIM